MPSPLTVRPGPPLVGEARVPGDKSITHRAYLIALLAPGETRVRGANPGADCEGTRACARALGVTTTPADGGVRLTRGELHAPPHVLDCGNSGSTMRMLPGVLAGLPFEVTLDGDESLRRRPVARIIEPLRAMGAMLRARERDRLPPLTIRGGVLRPFRGRIEQASAQVATAITLAALAADGESTIEIPGPARDHTERMLAACGVALAVEPLPGAGRRVTLRGQAVPGPRVFDVPGDPSAAAFFLAAAAARPGACVTVSGVSLNPTRTGLFDVMRAMGARVTETPHAARGGEPLGDVTVEGAELAGFDVPREWLPRLVDEVPAWVILAAQAHGVSRIAGAGELRVKESDRLAALAAGLTALGIGVDEQPDGLVVRGGPLRGGTIASEGDHRIAMAFATLATGGTAPVTIDDTRAIGTSFPGFTATLAALGGRTDPGDRRTDS